MATSSSSNFNNTCNEIIQSALRKCGMLAEGETATAQMVTDARGDLNRLVKGWGAIGLRIWSRQELVLFLDTTSQSYEIGTAGDECTVAEDLVQTTLATDEATSSTSIEVSSATGIASADRIGVVLDDGTMHWTTVNGAPAGAVVTITTGLASAASAGNSVYAYTSKAPRPTRVLNARVRNSSTSETPLKKLSNDDYFNLSNKSATGTPNSYYYQPRASTGILYVWPVTDSVSKRLNLTVERVIEDFDTSSDNPDLPQEWLQPLVWNLARELMLEYGVDAETKSHIVAAADFWRNEAMGYDFDDASIVFQPDFS